MTIRKENILLFIFFSFIFLFSIHGLSGNPTPTELRKSEWSTGPFESSNSRGRYALLYSMIENKSFQFSIPLAEFASPDLAYTNGRFVTLFAPGVSFVAFPGYLLGKFFGIAQVGTFAVISLFAIANFFLIKSIAMYLGANRLAAILGGIAFLLASPAFAYATTFFQHHVSTFFILLSLFLLIRFNSILSLSIIWFLFATAIVIDYPNIFMMLPIAIVALSQIVVKIKTKKFIYVTIHLARLVSLFAIIFPLGLFLWFNTVSFGNPFQLSGTLERVTYIKDGKPATNPDLSFGPQTKSSEKTGAAFFKNRNMLNGFYIHFLSPDRGMIRFTPLLFLGFVGLALAIKKDVPYARLLTAIIGFNVLLYSMWDDPYGGWAFGSRYLIPTYALLSIFLALLLMYWKKNLIFLFIFFLLFIYSLSVNSLGALTSLSNPPQVEILAFEKQTGRTQEYTYLRNMLELNKNYSQAYFFQTYARHHISAWNYYIAFTTGIALVFSVLLIMFTRTKKGERYAV